MVTKSTSEKVAKTASKVVKSPVTGTASKTAAGSALAQKGNDKKTSAAAASAASKVLRDGRTSTASKSAAGSALSQKANPSASGTSSGGPRKKK